MGCHKKFSLSAQGPERVCVSARTITGPELRRDVRHLTAIKGLERNPTSSWEKKGNPGEVARRSAIEKAERLHGRRPPTKLWDVDAHHLIVLNTRPH